MRFFKFYIDAETSDYSWRATSKFLLSRLLHLEYDVSVFQSTFFSAKFSLMISFFDLYFYITLLAPELFF